MWRYRTGAAARTYSRQHGFSLLEAIIVVAITLVLVAITSKAFLATRNNYNLNTAARQVQSLAQLARGKATGRDTRYRVVINTPSTNRYQMESCTVKSGSNCTTWKEDPQSSDIPLPAGVVFQTPSGVSSGPGIVSPAPTVAQAASMTFNSRGLQVDGSGNTVSANCFYLQGQTTQPMAVCSSLTGRTAVYRLEGSTWQQR